MADISDIMKRAMKEARARLRLLPLPGEENRRRQRCNITDTDGRLKFEGGRLDCQAHLDGLIVAAQLRALHEAGYAVVLGEPMPEYLGTYYRMLNTGSTEPGEYGDDRSQCAAYRAMMQVADLIPAALAGETP